MFVTLLDRLKRTIGSYLCGAAMHSEPYSTAKYENTSPSKDVSAKGEKNRRHEAANVSTSFIKFKVAPHDTSIVDLGPPSKSMSKEQVLAEVWQPTSMKSKRCKGPSRYFFYLFMI